MEWVDSISQILRKPFPEEESWWGYVRTTAVISIFVTFFLYIFEPFGIATIPSGKFLICLGFGGVSFLAMIFFDLIVGRLLKLKGQGKNFTFGKWMLYVVGLILTISLANFLFARSLFGTMRWEFFPQMIKGTFAIGIFPVVVVGALALMRQERKYQRIADEINRRHGASSGASSAHGPAIFDIPAGQIRYVESLQNYVRIGYINGAGLPEERVERATLKGILEEAAGSPIVRCHRSFLVNREAILSTSGNAQGLLLTLADCEKEVPVSRSFVPQFRETDQI